jgi:hypothetical protein
MLTTNSVTLHRTGDPKHEIREVWIYMLISPCELWESIRFLNDEHVSKRSKLALGSLAQMEAKHAEYIAELQQQDFVICEPTAPVGEDI